LSQLLTVLVELKVEAIIFFSDKEVGEHILLLEEQLAFVGRDPKVLRRVSRILIQEGLHFANLFYIFE